MNVSRAFLLALAGLLVTALVAPGLAAPRLASASVASNPTPRTVTVRGKLYTVSCMSSSLCLAGGLSSRQGLPVQLELIRSGRVIHTWNLTRFEGPPSVNCPTARECYAISRNAVFTDIVRVTSAGRMSKAVLRPRGGIKPVFNAISCVSATRCELAGLTIACHDQTCIAAGGSRLTFFSSGRETAHREVPSARAFQGVGTGPGSVFAAVAAPHTR